MATKNILLFCHIILLPTLACADAQTLSDPMRPAGNLSIEITGHQSTRRQGWLLTSTLIADERKLASLNNRLVSEGDTISGARVLKIESGEVSLEYQGKVMVVKLFSQTIRK